MRILLINSNPAVSRLISISAEKLRHQLNEIQSMENLGHETYDIALLDSEFYTETIIEEIKKITNCFHLMYICPRGSKRPQGADSLLEKPFLPTDFTELINEIEKNKPSASFSDEISNVEGLESLNTFYEDKELKNLDDEEYDISKEIIQTLDDQNAKILESLNDNKEEEVQALENLDDNEEVQEDVPELESLDDSEEEIKEDVKELESLDDNEEEVKEDIQVLEEDKEEISPDMQSLGDKDNELLKNYNHEEDINALENEFDLHSLEENNQLSQTDTLSLLVDEIESMDDDNQSSSLPELNETKTHENIDLLNAIQSLDDESSNNSLLEELPQLNEIKIDEDLDLPNKELEPLIKEESISLNNINSFKSLNEKDIMRVFGEETKGDQEDISKDSNKENLEKVENEIKDSIKKAIQESSIKETVKNMKINITVTFEDL